MEKSNIELNETEPKYKTVIGHYPSQKNRIRISKTVPDGCCAEAGGDYNANACTLMRRTSSTTSPSRHKRGSGGSSGGGGEDMLKPPPRPNADSQSPSSSEPVAIVSGRRSSFKQTNRGRNVYVMQQSAMKEQQQNQMIDESEVKFSLYPPPPPHKTVSASSSDTNSTFSSSSAEATPSSSSYTSATSSASSSASSTSTASSSSNSSASSSSSESRSSMIDKDSIINMTNGTRVQSSPVSVKPGSSDLSLISNLNNDIAAGLSVLSLPCTKAAKMVDEANINQQKELETSNNTSVVVIDASQPPPPPVFVQQQQQQIDCVNSPPSPPPLPPLPPPPAPPLPPIKNNSFNNLIKLDIRPIEVVSSGSSSSVTAAPATMTTTSPLLPPPPPPQPTSVAQNEASSIPNPQQQPQPKLSVSRTSQNHRRPLVVDEPEQHRCSQLRRNSSFPNKTASFNRRSSCVGVGVGVGVAPVSTSVSAAVAAATLNLNSGGYSYNFNSSNGQQQPMLLHHKIMMNGSLQYHDVKTKIQQFEKIRAEAAASVASTMSSSSVIGLGTHGISKMRASFLSHPNEHSIQLTSNGVVTSNKLIDDFHSSVRVKDLRSIFETVATSS